MCLLVWLLSDDRGHHIFSPKVQCQQNNLNLVNKARFPFVQKSIAIMTLGSNYHPNLFATGAVTFTKE
jgi:hypothetical protein